MTLAEHIAQAAATPFARGKCDCCTFVADWVIARRGIDPAGTLRGYSTDVGAMRRIRRAGGFVPLLTGLASACCLAVTDRPQPGDVGIVKTATTLSMGIRTLNGWACKEGPGIIIANFEPLIAWRV